MSDVYKSIPVSVILSEFGKTSKQLYGICPEERRCIHNPFIQT